MKIMKLVLSLVALTFLNDFSSLHAQVNGIALDGGRFMWRIEARNKVRRYRDLEVNGMYPADFKKDPGYWSNIQGGSEFYSMGRTHPWVTPNGDGISLSAPTGGTIPGDQKKYMRYAYPVITVDGQDAGLYQDPAFIVDPNLECEMKGYNRARSPFGITYYTTTYTWSHPDYQDIVIVHDQIVNDGNWFQYFEPVQEDTVDKNDYPEFFILDHRTYGPGFRSLTLQLWENNWNFWGYGVQDSITDPYQALMYEWNPDVKDAGSPLEDEGEWNQEDNRFWYPYYFGFGLLDADGPLLNNPKITNPIHWWGIETYPHRLWNSNSAQFKAFLQARYKYGVEPSVFQVEGGPKSYCNPHERDPDDDSAWNTFLWNYYDDAKMVFYTGPYDISIGDTINIWKAHIAGGIDPHYANELGTIWREKYDPETYAAGWSDEDINWKNNILRTAGINDMVNGYAKAKEIYANGMKIPKMNLVPPAWINITSGGGQVDIDWSPVNGAVGYNIYRGEGELEKLLYDRLDSVSSTTYNYSDTTAKRNFSYYYYVTAFDADGIESSHYTVRPLYPATPYSVHGKTLDDVRVVPNPFLLGRNGYGEGLEDRITFAGLPGPCKIKIYTISGDIVDEINHNVQDGSHQWDGRTKFNQYLKSGVYVYSVESTEGKGSKIGKFIVIR